MNTEGITGFKKNDFVSPEAVLGSDVRIEELPDGIRFYLKGQAVNLAEKRIVVRLYEKFQVDGGIKLRMDFLEKFVNRIPDEDEIALKYGPNDKEAGSEGYTWIAKWRDPAGEKGIISETIIISEKWRARYEAAQRKAQGLPDSLPAPVSAAPVPSAPAFGPLEMMKLLHEGEDRAFRNMERMAAVFRGNQSESPAAVLKEAYEGATLIMQKAVETNLDMAKKMQRTAARRIDEDDAAAGAAAGGEGGDGEGAGQGADPMDGIPAFIRPFIPQLETWLGTLIGGGPMGAAVRTLILSSDQWKEIFGDPEKFGMAVAAMEQHFGTDKTQKAMDILLSRRPAKGRGK